jgi:hypothetical protein
MINKNNFKYLKIFENFEEKLTPAIIKKISNNIRKDILMSSDNNFNKNYFIDDFNLNIIIDYKYGNKQPYYSNINIYDIISGVEPVIIKVLITDIKIDIDYLMSVISHEIRHIYDIYTISNDTEIIDFKKSMIISKFKNQNEFISLVYLSLEHELIARHNMLYELFRWINITDKKKLQKIFEKSYTFIALTQLQKFNAVNFINSQNENNLIKFTKEFSDNIGDDFKDLLSYYIKWEKFFKNKSFEFLGYVDKMLDDVIFDVKNDKIYERMCGFISYNEDILNNVSIKLFEKMIKYKNELKNE